MGAGLHHAAKTRQGGLPVRGHVDHVLHLRMIEDEAEYRSVLAVGEAIAESVAVHAARAGQPSEDTAEEVDLTLLVVAGDGLVVHALVDEVAVEMVQAADGVHVFQGSEPLLQTLEPSSQIVIAHGRTSPFSLCTAPAAAAGNG